MSTRLTFALLPLISVVAVSCSSDSGDSSPATAAAATTTTSPNTTTSTNTTMAPTSTIEPSTTLSTTNTSATPPTPAGPEALADPPLILVGAIAPVGGFDKPVSIGIDTAAERVYVVDSANRRIVSFALDGTDETIIQADGVPFSFHADGPLGSVDVAADGSLYVAEAGAARILHLSADGTVLAEFTLNAEFGRLFSVSVDTVSEVVYAVDDDSDAIVVFDLDGNEVGKLVGRGRDPGEIADPGFVHVQPDGTLWVADPGNHRVQHVDSNGSVVQVIGPFDESDERHLEYPNDMAVDADGRIWVADYLGKTITIFAPDGTLLGRFRDERAGWAPVSLTFDLDGRLYVSDIGASTVSVYEVSPIEDL